MAVKSEAEILFKASHRNAGISARKARLVMDLIRGQKAEKALVRLEYCDRRASPMIRKVLESAIANAAQMSGVESENLVVHAAYADEGATMKRWRPRSMGRAFPRLKRSCHLSVALAAVESEGAVPTADVEETITEEAVIEEAVAEEAVAEEEAVDVAEDEVEENDSGEEAEAGEDEASEDAVAEESPEEDGADEDETEAGAAEEEDSGGESDASEDSEEEGDSES
ncbi:MAG TPA: 50S ribosomal protein L22 [Planctomycetes bacterium]|nr:50S ribosomal protein L22 [Planctomycetota bacterium]|tara:strand:- start:557 stop:1234 length:678 start_codon:yes stop_codon:yes gene_type:complete